MAPTVRSSRTGSRSGAGWFRPTLSLLAVALLAGCSLFETGSPERIQVLVEGDPGQEARLVVSQEFLLSGSEDGSEGIGVTFGSSDTLAITLPFERSFNLAPTFQFVARTYGPVSGDTITVRMRVLVDGDERYNQTGPVEESFLQFIYLFQ